MLLQSGCLNACSEPQTRALPRQAAAATSTPKSAKPENREESRKTHLKRLKSRAAARNSWDGRLIEAAASLRRLRRGNR